MIILKKTELILVGVVYYRRDFPSLLNEYYWQTEDYVPDLPRLHRFLMHWKKDIGATIKDVLVSYGGHSNIRPTEFWGELH